MAIVEAYQRTIMGVGFNPNSIVTMTISSAPGGVLLAQTTSAEAIVEKDKYQDQYNFFWSLNALSIPVLLTPGMEIRISDGEVTITQLVLPFAIDEVALDTDTISGSGAPGAGLEIIVCPGGEEPAEGADDCSHLGSPRAVSEGDNRYDPRFVVNDAGRWEIDLRSNGIDLTEASRFLLSSSLATDDMPDPDNPAERAVYNGLHNGGRAVLNWPPDTIEPQILAVLDLDMVVVEELSYGFTAELTIRASAGGEGLFSDSQAVEAGGDVAWRAPPHGDLTTELEPGMEITVSWGETARTGILDDLRVNAVNHELNRVTGSGPAGETLFLVIGDASGDEFVLAALDDDVKVAPNGAWQADFSEDIKIGMTAVAILQPDSDSAFRTAAAGVAVVVPEIVEENASIVEASDEAEVVISSAGGDGSLAKVAVPAAALPTGSSVRVAAISNTADLIDQVAVPAGTDVALGFSITAEAADGTAVAAGFAAPVAVEFTINSGSLPVGYDPNNLRIAFWNGGRWAALENVEVTINGDGTVTLSALTNHFTLFTIISDPAGAVRPGPADPLDEVSMTGLSSLGLAPTLVEDATKEPASSLSARLIVGIAAAAVVLVTVAWFILRRRRQISQS